MMLEFKQRIDNVIDLVKILNQVEDLNQQEDLAPHLVNPLVSIVEVVVEDQ